MHCILFQMTNPARSPKIKTRLNIVVENEMSSTVLSQQAESIMIGEVLKLHPIEGRNPHNEKIR